MSKVWLSIILLMLFAVGIFLVSFKVSREIVYNEDDTCFDSLRVNAGGDDDITDIFCFSKEEDGQECHYMFMPSCANIDDFAISFYNADHIIIAFPEGERSYKNHSHVKGVEINKDYAVRFEDVNDNVLESGSIVFLQSENLPTAFIETQSMTMDEIDGDAKHNYREEGRILIIDEVGNINITDKLEYLKGHGNTSWEKDKKGYQFKFFRDRECLGLGKSEKWLLIANYDYISEEKNAFVYDMAKQVGLKGTPDFKYTDVYINGRYAGIYLLGGKIESGEDRLDIVSLEDKNNILLDGQHIEEDHSTELVHGEYLGYDIGGEPDDITGGYILERDTSTGTKFKEHASRFITERGDTYGIKEPNIATEKEAEYISEVFQRIEDGIYNGEDVSNLIDMESFADKFLLEEIVKNSASSSTSWYYYKDSDTVDSKLYAGPAWDYDKALGATGHRMADEETTLSFCDIHPDTSYLFYMLYSKNDNFRQMLKTEYLEQFRPYLEIAVSDGGVIDSIRDEYGKNNGMDAIRWDKDTFAYSENAERLKYFLNFRINLLDNIFIEGKKVCTVYYVDDKGYGHYIGVLEGEGMATMPDDRRWRDSETNEEIENDTPIIRDMKIEAFE